MSNLTLKNGYLDVTTSSLQSTFESLTLIDLFMVTDTIGSESFYKKHSKKSIVTIFT